MFRWSALRADSNSFWSSEKRGAALAVVAAFAALAFTRRYSSRAAACSSGKPSKPRAWEKRTTVELEVFARRASSSAVWNAASSRWSTMYWATSFCEREHSSKRAWMYEERAWWPCGESAVAVGLDDGFMGRLTFDAGRRRSFTLLTGRAGRPREAS